MYLPLDFSRFIDKAGYGYAIDFDVSFCFKILEDALDSGESKKVLFQFTAEKEEDLDFLNSLEGIVIRHYESHVCAYKVFDLGHKGKIEIEQEEWDVFFDPIKNIHTEKSLEYDYLTGRAIEGNHFHEELFGELLKRRNFISSVSPEGFLKLLKYLTFSPLVLEQMVKTLSLDMVISELNSKDQILSNQGKLHQTIGISRKALSKMQELKVEECLESLKLMAELNENYPLMFLEFLESFYKLLARLNVYKAENRAQYYRTFSPERLASSIVTLLGFGYEMKPLQNYILKQTLLYRNGSIGRSKTDKHSIQWIDNTAISLCDYVQAAEELELKYEKYPAMIHKAHDIFVKNYKSVDDPKLSKDFEEVSKTRLNLEVSNKDYSLVLPKTLKDLVHEGNALHHCVGTYGRKIVEEGLIVVFFRLNSSIDTPFVTVELMRSTIMKKYIITQAKGVFHEDPEKKVFKEIKRLVDTLEV